VVAIRTDWPFLDVDAANRRILATLLFSVFATVIGVGIVVPLLPVHAHGLGAGGIGIALVFGAYALARACFLPVFARWSDRRGRKAFLTIGLLMYAVVSLALACFDSIVAWIAIRLLHGVASAMLIPVFQAYAAELAPAGREGRVMGLYGGVVLAGMSLGPFAGGLISDHFGFRATFWIMGALALAGFMACTLLLPATSNERTLHAVKTPVAWRALLRDRELKALLVFRTSYVVCVGIIWGFVPLHASLALPVNSASIGLILTLGIASGGVLNAPMGLLADHFDRRAMIAGGGILAIFGVVAFALATSYRDFVLASICFGVGGGVCMPALMASAARKGSGADAMASVMALMTIAHSAGMLVGAVLGGVAMQLLSLHWVFPIGGFAMAVGTIQYLCVGSEFEVPDAETPPAPHGLAAGAGSPL